MDHSIMHTIKLAVLAVAAAVITAALLTWGPPRVNAAPDAAADYKAKCASCHGTDGKGTTPVGKAMNLRDLGSAEVQSQTDEQLFEVISKGKGKMPGYEKSLGADKCKEQVTYIRTLKQ
jgi:cytochrome c553